MRLSVCLGAALFAVALTAPARAEEPTPAEAAHCADEKSTCREDCSIELGTSEETRWKIGACVARCDQSETVCRQRLIAKRTAMRGRNAAGHAAPEPPPSTSTSDASAPEPSPKPSMEWQVRTRADAGQPPSSASK